MTLTEYAKRRGCSVKSVSIAASSGRLVESVGRDERGRPVILDPELADREWTANTRRRADRPGPEHHPGAPEIEASNPRPREQVRAVTDLPLGDWGAPLTTVPPYNESRDLRAAADARKAVAAAGIAEIELEEKRGSVVPVAEVRAEVIERYSLVKTRLLAVPSAVGQRMPDIAVRVVAVVDELVREALEELSVDGLDA